MSNLQYFMIERTKGKPSGNPIFLEFSLLSETCGINRSEDDNHFYYTNCEKQPLVFICKQKVINFDIYNLSSGEFFISDRFLSVIKKTKVQKYKIISVVFLSSKRENIAKTNYYVIRFFERLDAVDIQKSVIETSERYSFLKVTKHLSLDEHKIDNYDLFMIDDMTLIRFLFCSNKFKEHAEQAKINIEFFPVDKAAEIFHERNL